MKTQQDNIQFLLSKGASWDDACDFMEHWQNLLSNNENLKRFKEFIKQ